MENEDRITTQEADELRKSLITLGMSEVEADEYIEKAKKGEVEDTTQQTVQDQAAAEGATNDEGVEKEDTDIEKCAKLKSQKADIEKAIAELEEKMGTKPVEEEIKKSVDEDMIKSIQTDIEKSFGEKLIDIEKAITDRFTGIVEDLRTTLNDVQAEVKKIGDTPVAMKSVFTKANFFEKSTGEDLGGGEERELSITRDKDELLKSMQDMFEKETNTDARLMLQEGISDYTVNTVPTSHGIRALAYLSRKKNITLGQ